ncbi:hypothetical protein LCGC14_2098550 [marine sediment metagenome]|uniref:UDP-N-acetylglucosamine 2-epimerase domain-containing protein n=1 Tax=marine sediment metagenome TaxID=412755 RepID=A0A0F9EAU9_9ZZZZ
MIDNLIHQVERLKNENASQFESSELKKDLGRYAFLTLHRPSNVDDGSTLTGIFQALNEISADSATVFPIHPSTRKMIDKF